MDTPAFEVATLDHPAHDGRTHAEDDRSLSDDDALQRGRGPE